MYLKSHTEGKNELPAETLRPLKQLLKGVGAGARVKPCTGHLWPSEGHALMFPDCLTCPPSPGRPTLALPWVKEPRGGWGCRDPPPGRFFAKQYFWVVPLEASSLHPTLFSPTPTPAVHFITSHRRSNPRLGLLSQYLFSFEGIILPSSLFYSHEKKYPLTGSLKTLSLGSCASSRN